MPKKTVHCKDSHFITFVESLAISTAAFAFAIGLAAVCINPGRFTNQIFGLISVLIVIEVLFIYLALVAPNFSAEYGEIANPVLWVRANAAVIGLFPWALWLMKESILAKDKSRMHVLRQSLPWLALGLGLGIICFTHAFIPPDSQSDAPKRGLAYTFRVICLFAALIILIVETIGQLTKLAGIKYIEARFLVVNGGLTAIASLGFFAVGTFLNGPEFKGLALVITLIGYAVMAWAMTVRRVFDIRQILASVVQRIVMVLVLGLSVLGMSQILDSFVSKWISVGLSVIVCGVLIVRLDRISREWIGFSGQARLALDRKVLLEMASKNLELPNFTRELEVFFSARHDAMATVIVTATDALQNAVNNKVLISEGAFKALCTDGWATPETLERRRGTSENTKLKEVFEEYSFGLMLTIPAGSKTPSLFLAFGQKCNEWPYTYPEVECLLKLAELVDSLLNQSRVATQAALRSRVEQLALASKGLAHDLKNLFTPISAFLLHMEGRFKVGDSEHEVHLAAMRAMRSISDYTREALVFGDAFHLKTSFTPITAIVINAVQVTSYLASEKGVSLEMDCEEGLQLAGDAVLVERLIFNLIVNAIDASPRGGRVQIIANRCRPAWFQLIVSDQGCGISLESGKKVFEPYYSTKNFGVGQRGFGLGLTISQKIAELHGGEITLSSDVGRGAMFRVELPATAVAEARQRREISI